MNTFHPVLGLRPVVPKPPHVPKPWTGNLATGAPNAPTT